jgi:tRNA(adenine34) deaminase
MKPSDIDIRMMRRCVELSAAAVQAGELPFSCVICKEGEIVVETTNRVMRDADVTRHAEIIAISEAQRVLGRKDLSDCTLYSNVEPCPMCSFPIRETRIGRVVYSISSPMMGGLSKWGVLSDREISDVMPQVFGRAPDISAGLMYRDAAAIWRSWNPLFWFGIRLKGCLAESNNDAMAALQTRPARKSLLKRLVAFASQALPGKRSEQAQVASQVAARQPQAKIAG